MSLETATEYLKKYNKDKEIKVLKESTATVSDAAIALNTDPDTIAKSLAISDKLGGCIILVISGTSKLDNHKFKEEFGYRPRMLSIEDTYRLTSHKVGGVCPFGLNDSIKVYLDISLKKHSIVYPGCGTGNSLIKLSIDELEYISNSVKWVDVCK